MLTRYERWTRQKRSRSRLACRSSIVRYVDLLLAQTPDDPRAGQAVQLYVHKHHLRLEALDQLDRLQAVGTGCDYFNFGEIAEEIGEFIARKLFIVNDNCSDGSRRAV